MPKPQKLEAVSELKERLERADAALLTEYRGLKVQEMKELRRTLAESGTDLKVVKNTLTRIAAKQAKLEELLPLLEGSTAIAFIQGDPVAAAKGLDDMAKKYPSLVVKGGVLDGKVFGPEQAQALAKVKPREVLLTQLAGMMQAPLQSLANLLTAPLRELGYALGAYRAKLEQEAPAEEAAPEPAAEAAEPAAETTSEAPAAPEAAEQTAEAETAEAETAEAEPAEATTEASEPAAEAETTSEPESAPESETAPDSEPAAAAPELTGGMSDVVSDATDVPKVADPLPDEGAEGIASPSKDDNIENNKQEEE